MATQSILAAAVSASSWRPPQWDGPAMVQLIVPPQSNIQAAGAQGTEAPGTASYTFSTSVQASTVYVFDAVFRLAHSQRLEKTQHPVQTGANLSSHAYLLPPSVELDIGMSDSMQQYASSGTYLSRLISGSPSSSGATEWSGQSGSKSVNAYQQLLTLQQSRVALTLITRLRKYENLLITSIEPTEDYRTKYGLRARVVMEMIITATVSSQPVSAAPNDTNTTSMGVETGTTVPDATINQFTYSGLPVNIPGAGQFSSMSGISSVITGLIGSIPTFPRP